MESLLINEMAEIAEEQILSIYKYSDNSIYRLRSTKSERLEKVLDTAVNKVLGNERFLEKVTRLKDYNYNLFVHGLHVATLSVMIGSRLLLSNSKLIDLSLSGLLHDIGKLYISNNIIEKDGPLSDEEWLFMKKHSFVGSRIIDVHFNDILSSSKGVLDHHEKWNGSGYPNGLIGEEISLFGRIIAIADAYDALTSARSYKAPVESAVAISIIKKDKGTHFDPFIVDVFLSIF